MDLFIDGTGVCQMQARQSEYSRVSVSLNLESGLFTGVSCNLLNRSDESFILMSRCHYCSTRLLTRRFGFS